MVDADRPKWSAIDRNEWRMLSHREKNLSFRKTERLLGTASIRRTNSARWRDHREDRRGLPVKSTPDRTHRLPSLPAIPDLRPLGCRVINATSLFHVHTPSLIKD